MKNTIRLITYALMLYGVVNAQTGITVGTGADVTVGQGATINISNGKFTVLAEQNGRGSFLEKGDLSFTGTGEARMQQYLTKDQWHVVSTPMNNENIAVYEWMYLYEWDEPTHKWTYLNLPLTTPLNPGEGYDVWNTLDTNTIYPNTPYYTVTHNGTFNKNDIVVSSLTNTAGSGNAQSLPGWNLLGNPFPCAIDWNGDSDWNLNRVDATVYLADYSGSGNYPIWNYNTNSGVDKYNGYKAATQGFWVKVNNTNSNPPTLTIPASQRLHSDTTTFYKSGNETQQILRLRVEGNDLSDETLIQIIPGTSDGFDNNFDAYKLKGREEAPQLYSFVEDKMVCMNILPAVSEDLVIPLGFEVGASDIYEITASGFEGFDDATEFYLEDMKENIVHDLRKNPVYTFTASPLDEPERFVLHFNSSTLKINETETENSINIIAQGNKLLVDVADGDEGYLQIQNILGQELGRNHLKSGRHNIPVSVNGVVIVTWIGNNSYLSKKFFIK